MLIKNKPSLIVLFMVVVLFISSVALVWDAYSKNDFADTEGENLVFKNQEKQEATNTNDINANNR